MDMILLVALFLYLFLVLGLPFISKAKLKTTEDFFLAGRHLSSSLVYFSLTASWIGATSTLVATDEAWRQGLSSLWIMAAPTIITVMIFALFLVKPLRKLEFVSLPDLIEARYGRFVRHLVALLIIWYMILLAAAQLVAGGKLLAHILALDYIPSLLIIILVVLLYSARGGLFSVALTDACQSVLIFGGILLLALLWRPSSPGNTLPLFSANGASNYLNPFFNFKNNFLICLSFVLAWVISPITWQRIQAAPSAPAARRSLWLTIPTFFLFFSMVMLIGFKIPKLNSFLPDSLDSAPLLVQLIKSSLSPSLKVLLFIGILAAIMSTLDTAINTGALSLTQDVFLQMKKFSSMPILLLSRGATILIGLLALAIASQLQTILQSMGLASEIMAEGLFIPGITMLFLNKKLPWAGLLSLSGGGCFALVGFLVQIKVIPLNWPLWPASLPWGLAFCLGGFGLGLIIDMYCSPRRIE